MPKLSASALHVHPPLPFFCNLLPFPSRYYHADNMYMFDRFQTANTDRRRRPALKSLYDVFIAIRDDEEQHALTMTSLEGARPQVHSSHP